MSHEDAQMIADAIRSSSMGMSIIIVAAIVFAASMIRNKKK